ncbi:hypothetical protein [Deinococcus cellulosilyticus]|uniref:Uncharacterized protein n=1 Tax=Deinococcus cellulosilyticus (strain DSM 18568 / NBRC 106333 / KACC 11606 / 5516J-15) TaxID=1223518 RepID=A0A511N4L9_DEIC1|nr:hypothetical protein [Deinococcus cellulosilyticus]GEM47810.1 hypothetical protein DC3_34450 [Deinococcus cellulosilyticus NBRC 106333 = KACC 11606]
MNLLAWLARKWVALLVASLVATLLFQLLNPESSSFSLLKATQTLFLNMMMTPLAGFLPALVTTALSDLIRSRMGAAQQWAAVGIHLAGGWGTFLLIFQPFDSPEAHPWAALLVVLVAALAFSLTDEQLRSRRIFSL